MMSPAQQQLAVDHMAIAAKVASECRFRFSSLSFAELESAALLALCLAAMKFTPGRASFSAYASCRCRGACLEEIRESHLIHVPNYQLRAKAAERNSPGQPFARAARRVAHVERDRLIEMIGSRETE